MICQHGQLARQCEMCDKDREIAQLRAASLRLLDALDRLDHGSREPGFRGWENGYGEPCGDEVEDARQSARQLVEALRDAMAPAAPAAAMLGELWVAFGNYEGRLIALPEYAAASERAVKEKILEAARREGFAGTSDERIGALGWTIRRVLPTDASPSQPLPASGGDKEKT